jgi:hypothetical protein
MKAAGLALFWLALHGAGAALFATENVISVNGFATSADTSLFRHVQAGFNFGHGMIYDFDESIALDADRPSGIAVRFEHRRGSLAFAVSAGWTSIDLPYSWEQLGTPRFPDVPPFSPTRSTGTFARVDLYPVLVDIARIWNPGTRAHVSLGATVGVVAADARARAEDRDFGNGFNFLPFEESGTDTPGPVAIDVSSAVALGAMVGVDFDLTPRLRPTLRVRWLDADLDVGAVGTESTLELGPWWIELGVGWKI